MPSRSENPTGTTDTAWTTASDWSPGGVPASTDTVTIVTGSNPCHLTQNTTVNRITLTSGTLQLHGFTLTVNNHSTFNGGTVSGAESTIGDTMNLRMVRWLTDKWKDLGHGPVSGNLSTGSIRSQSAVSSYGYFLLGMYMPPIAVADTDTASLELDFHSHFTNDADEYAYSISKTHDGNYIMAGGTKARGNGGIDILLIKLKEDADTVWIKTFGDRDDEEAISVILYRDNGFAIAGYTNSYGNGMKDMYLMKTDSLGNFTTGIEYFNIQVQNYSIIPNPVTEQSQLLFGNARGEEHEFVVFDITGRAAERQRTHGSSITLTRSNHRAGLYIFRLRNTVTGEVVNGKVVFE